MNVEDWHLYEDRLDMLTDSLIAEVQAGDRKSKWKLVLIFKSEILKAGNKLAKVLKEELGRPNNGPEPEWLMEMEGKLVKGYQTSYKLNYWNENELKSDDTEVKNNGC